MSAFRLKPLLQCQGLQIERNRCCSVVSSRQQRQRRVVISPSRPVFRRLSCAGFRGRVPTVKANSGSASETPITGADQDVLFQETFRVMRNQLIEGKVTAKLVWGKEKEKDGGSKGELLVGCSLEGKWLLHWGVTYCDEFGSEWDQPPAEMRPPGSVAIKDYAIETPLKKSPSSLEGQILHEVKIDLDSNFSVAAVHFVLKDGDTGEWFQHRGRDFRIPLLDYPQDDDAAIGGERNVSIWPGVFSQISSLLIKSGGSQRDTNAQDSAGETKDSKQEFRLVEGFYEEFPILKEEPVENIISLSVKRRGDGMNVNQLYFDTDIPGQVVVHWGVCRDNNRNWEIPDAPHPPNSRVLRRKAIQTLLQQKANGVGSFGLFPLPTDISGVIFVLKLNEYTWLRNVGGDFFIPLFSETKQVKGEFSPETKTTEVSKTDAELVEHVAYTNEIITDIRNLVTDISAEKSNITKTKEEQENILEEIEKLAAEAYSIFRSSIPIFVEEPVPEVVKPPVQISPGTGTGYEILCQGFNWESNKSGRWYADLSSKAAELSKFGFTTIWLPPPTQSVSPEGYMPTDLYNLNSRYGSIEELKILVKNLHAVGIKVLGDVVLNHRCAQYKNQNGIWNIFGGHLNWDDRAIVSDDPHFQGRGNKSSGDHFHAAPNIDHSQEFVRKDIKEWLCWLREEVGYDGWRLDFVRGFWGGYVKDYLEASRPFFAVGEYWDSLSYTYGQMDHNQDAHRQRIVDWINATNGNAGAFDVTTKGILHTALEKCEYWRLSDEKGKPPGVLGWWPSRAVTFIENHDTGSTQGHWRFPAGKEMQGYAYILTHPGTPTVFYDHIFSHYQQEIANLLSIRTRLKIHCRSTVKISKAERDVYAAVIDGKVAMKIGPGYYEPPSGSNSWSVAAEGRDYKIWEPSS